MSDNLLLGMEKTALADYLQTTTEEKQERRAQKALSSVTELPMPDRQEILAASHNRKQPPIPNSYDFFTVPFAFLSRVNNHIEAKACSFSESPLQVNEADLRLSTFWHVPVGIGDQDLYHGFGRSRSDWGQSEIWEYAGPKVNYGINPGFEVIKGKEKIRVKFAETHSEPFASRIFWALEYNVDVTDYCEGLKVKYSRRLFREFNVRKEIQTQFRFLVLPLYSMKLQKRYDPFSYIAWAVMKDRRRISGSELRHELLINPAIGAEDDTDNFRPEVEEAISYLVTVPANVQLRSEIFHSIGPWRFDDLDHAKRREVRAVGLLAAWIGWYDNRFHNTKLKVAFDDSRPKLVHYFSDLGGGLGKANGLLSGKAERPNDFAWTFTTAARPQGKGRMTIPFRVTGFRPMEKNRAFAEMTIDDARWMARLIAQLSESQILQVLLGAGFDSAQARLYAEKLISRRDRMILDLGLGSELPPLRPAGIDTRFNYSPRRDGPVSVALPSGEVVFARAPGGRVVEGLLREEVTPTPMVVAKRP